MKLLNSRLNEYIEKDDIESFLKLNIENIHGLASETKNRANMMLFIGLLMSFTAITIFYLTLPSYESKSYETFIFKGIRPFAILIFIESIAWYLLKQYRKMIYDYKFFYNIYQTKLKHLELYKLLKNREKVDVDKLVEYISNENIPFVDLTGKELVDNSSQIDFLKGLLSKIK